MINCNYYGINEHIFFSTNANEKQHRYRQILNGITDRVFDCYDLYINNFSGLCAQNNSAFDVAEEDERAALQLCYSSGTASFNFFKANIITEQPDVLKTLCPYCMLDRPSTLDHYVGQSEFPEYSIMTRNLVPCCYECNNVKRTGWRNGINRRYINFYDDQFLVFAFLHASLLMNPGQVAPLIVFELIQPAEIMNEDFLVIESHFENLTLLRQYEKKANSRLSTEITSIKNSIDDGTADIIIRDNLMSRFIGFAADFGVNYWEAVIYRTLANSLDLIHAL